MARKKPPTVAEVFANKGKYQYSMMRVTSWDELAAAQEAGRGLAFINEVATTLWGGQVTGWDQGDHLAKAAARAGLDLAALDGKITNDVDRYEKIVADNEAAHAASNHWGVPCFVYKGEPFFGQDRIDLLVWRLKQNGLQERAA